MDTQAIAIVFFLVADVVVFFAVVVIGASKVCP
jgi:hypothetical protein